MADYNLDALGWAQFERVVQALIKADVGLAIEAWSGPSDLGRDAWTTSPLGFPIKGVESEGPFLFQMKFVSGANAAGANWLSSIRAAVKAEVAAIKERRKDDEEWLDPAHYVFVTNAPLKRASRREVEAEIRKALKPRTKVTAWGASDLDGMLDASPKIRASYPQLLGLRDLTELLAKVVNAETIKRSEIQLELTRDLAKVFVPTAAYDSARRILSEHHFVVLTGPPEMGKTAIARMIALAQLSADWQAIESLDPATFFSMFDRDTPQVFVADDAFGATEYSPTLGEVWARDMERILARLDSNHWVIFTSRPAPLHKALETLYFQGAASGFPNPNKVRVDASRLSKTDKAFILYRHAKAAGFPSDVVQFLQHNARSLVEDPRFTPLRIRRFVEEDLGSIVEMPKDRRKIALKEARNNGLRAPTTAMTTSFRGLPLAYRRALVAMLDASESSADLDNLVAAMERHEVDGGEKSPADVVRSLDEHFVRVMRIVSS